VVGDKSARALSTGALLANPTRINLGELLWRGSLPLMALLLMLLAIPLSFVNPRAGRSANLMIALLLAVVYSNMVSVFQAAVAQGRLPLSMAWWPVHLIAALVIALLFSWRLTVNSRYHPGAAWAGFKRAWTMKKASPQ
jgi:lipopolysaccharide export system permease protein